MELNPLGVNGFVGLGEALSWIAWRKAIPHLDLCTAIDADKLGDSPKDYLRAALVELFALATNGEIAVYGKPRRHLSSVERDTVPITRLQLVDHQRYEIVNDALLRGEGLVWWPSPLDVILNDNEAASGFENVVVDRADLIKAFPPPTQPVAERLNYSSWRKQRPSAQHVTAFQFFPAAERHLSSGSAPLPLLQLHLRYKDWCKRDARRGAPLQRTAFEKAVSRYLDGYRIENGRWADPD